MACVGVLVVAASAALAVTLIRGTGSAQPPAAAPSGGAPTAGTPVATAPAGPGTESGGNGVCLSGQACATTPWFQQPDFTAVAIPMLLRPLRMSQARTVAALEGGRTLTQIAASAGLSQQRWYQVEASAVGAGLDALIAKDELAIPGGPGGGGHPDITTARQYRDFIVQAAYSGRLDNVLSTALGVPLQQIPGAAGA